MKIRIIQTFLLFLLSNIFILEMDAQESYFTSSELLQQKSSFAGKWIRTEPDSVVLEIVDYSADSFAFTMISYNPDYYGYIRADYDSSYKYAVYKDSDAYFNDEGAISDGRPLYYEGENPCEMLFKISSNNTMLIGEKNCYMIYGGAGITWEGEYWKLRNH